MKTMMNRLPAILLLLVFIASGLFGEYLYWWPLSGNDWNTAINWAYYSGGWRDAWVPTSNDHVKFGFEDWGDAPCYVTGTANCRAISIVDVGQLRITGGTLNISGVWSGEQISMVVYHNGDFRQTSGTMNLTATNTSLEHNLWVGIDPAYPSRIPTYNMVGGTVNQTNYNLGTGGYSGDIGKCFVVDGTANISGGTINLDDDFILHGTINHSGGTINTGWDSNNGGVWVSGSSGNNARYYLSGTGEVNVERYMFTSGYNASPWNFGLGTGRFQATGGTVGLTRGGAASGKVFVYDGGDTHSFFNNVEVYGLTTVEATFGNYMWVNGTMYLTGGTLRPFSAVRFPGASSFGRIIDRTDIYDTRPDGSTSIDEGAHASAFHAEVRQVMGGASIEVASPEYMRAELSVYDISGRVVYSKALELSPGRSSHQIEMGEFASGVYYYRLSSPRGEFTGKMVNIR